LLKAHVQNIPVSLSFDSLVIFLTAAASLWSSGNALISSSAD
jgi:hypothetical protein